MSDRENETLANIITRSKGARSTLQREMNQSVQRAPDALATQADIAGVYQVVAQLIQQQQQTQAPPQSTSSMELYYERFKRLNLLLFERGPDPLVAEI